MVRLHLFFVLLFTSAFALGETARVSTLAGSLTSAAAIDGPGIDARLSTRSLAADSAGNVYFGDLTAGTIRRMSPAGVVTTIAGIPNKLKSVDGPAGTASFAYPNRITRDSSGNLFVADGTLLRKVAPDGSVSTIAGNATGQSIVDGQGTAARFAYIMALAADNSGNVYVSDGGSLRRVTADGRVTTLVPSRTGITSDWFYAQSLAVDAAGNVFVANGNGVRKVAPDGTVTNFAGATNDPLDGPAVANPLVDGPVASATFQSVTSLAFDSGGNLWLFDWRLLRRISPDGIVTTMAGQRDAVVALCADGTGGNATFDDAGGLVGDGNGTLYFRDGGYAETIIRKVATVAGGTSPILNWGPRNAAIARSVGAGATVSFLAAAFGDAPLRFQWNRNGAAIAGATGAQYTIASASAADQGDYTVTIANPVGTYTSAASTLNVFTSAYASFTLRHSVAGGPMLWGIASSGSLLVAVGDRGRVLISTDGRTWTTIDAGTSEWLLAVTYAAGKYVVVGDHGTILVSTDARVWHRAASSGTTQRLNNVAYGDGRFVAVGEAGAIVESTDAEVWTAQNSGVSGWLRGLVYVPRQDLAPGLFGDNGTGTFYAAGQDGVMLNRKNGWAPEGRAGGPDIEAIADGAITVGAEGQIHALSSYVLYSKGGAVTVNGQLYLTGSILSYWQSAAIGLPARFRGVARGAGAVFATGENGVVAAAPGFGGPWTFIPTRTTANLVSAVFSGNSLFVVGENETILQSEPFYSSRLINIATRGQVGEGDASLISGFVVAGSSPKTVLIRAAGPSLTALGVSGAIAAPVLTLYDANGQVLGTNDGWARTANVDQIRTAAAKVGAFPFTEGSTDAAILTVLPPGAYTAKVSGANRSTGVTLVEVYDADGIDTVTSRAVNISTRGLVGTGENRLIAGFVIGGSASRKVLIRAVGPSLAAFGLGGLLGQPQIELFGERGRIQTAGAWSSDANADAIYNAGTIAGAFPLGLGSNDAAIVTTLAPGNYTVQVSGANGGSGVAMVEVYDLP